MELRKLAFIEQFHFTAEMFQDIPTKVLHTYRLRVSKEPLPKSRRHPEAQRSALVAIFAGNGGKKSLTVWWICSPR